MLHTTYVYEKGYINLHLILIPSKKKKKWRIKILYSTIFAHKQYNIPQNPHKKKIGQKIDQRVKIGV